LQLPLIVSSPSPTKFHFDTLTNIYKVSMITKEDLEALEMLKSTEESLTFSLEIELKKLESRYKALESEHDQQKSHLIDALLSKGKFQQDLAEKTRSLEALTAGKEAAKEEPSEIEGTETHEVSNVTSSTVQRDPELAAELALLGKRPSIPYPISPILPTFPRNVYQPLEKLDKLTSPSQHSGGEWRRFLEPLLPPCKFKTQKRVVNAVSPANSLD
jgi:hypothetical protein